jgi:hypothetical protein
MSDAEDRWRQHLGPVNLVIECNFTAEDVRAAQRNFGSTAEYLQRRGYRPSEIIEKYPALTLTILVGHAALAYDQGAYWDDFWSELQMYREQTFESTLRHQLVSLLERFKLARFPQLERQHQYVMMLAMHAGIPVHCLGDLLGVIDDHLVQGRETRGAAVLDWLDEPGKDYRMARLDVPVRNFLRFGGEFAVDILDRIIEVVEYAVDQADSLAELSTSTTGLPSVLLDELIRELRNKRMYWRGRRASGRSAQQRPVLAYGLSDDEIVVKVPYPRVHPELPWRVSMDGQIREVYAERAWGAGGADHPATPVPIPAPVREVSLWHDASDSNFALRVVEKSDPLLTFSPDGTWIPRRDGLNDAVWAVYPADCQLVDPLSGQVIDVSGDSGNPTGWRGWRSSYVELASVAAVQLQRNGELIGVLRTVRNEARARFEFGEPIPGCKDRHGHDVYPRRPWVMLPPTSSGAPTSWRVRVRPFADTDWRVDEFWDSEDEPTCVDPFDDAGQAQLGLFEIAVTGPLGADTRAVVFLAEGLRVEFDCQFRAPVAGGLNPCFALTGSDGRLTTSPDELTFERAELEKPIEVSDGTGGTQLVIRPPHLEIRTGTVGTHAPWRITADACTAADLAKNRYVSVRAPGAHAVTFAYLDAAGRTLQVEDEPRRRPGGVVELSTQRFADTGRHCAVGRIVAQVGADTSMVQATVVSVRPPKLCSGVRIVNGALCFDDLLDVEDLAAYVWCSTAPWRALQVLPIEHGSAQLPPDLVNAGELRCQIFVDDPWVALEPPQHPDESAWRVKQPGWFSGGPTAQAHLARFLAGLGVPPHDAAAMPEIWPALMLLESDLHDRAAQRSLAGLTKSITAQPRKALEGLGNSMIGFTEKMVLLVRTELVRRSYAESETFNALHADPWFGCMVEIADLPSLYYRREEVRDERAETIGYLAEKGGQPLIEALRTGKAVTLREGCFDRSVLRMDALPSEQVEQILLELQLIPGPLLHPDTRVAAIIDAFRARSEWMHEGSSESLSVQTSFALTAIRRASAAAYEMVAFRDHELHGVDVAAHPWMLMSVQSMTLAVLARLEAHGRITSEYLHSWMMSAWARLAALSPRMVATDLLIAEALVIHDCYGDLIGDTPHAQPA